MKAIFTLFVLFVSLLCIPVSFANDGYVGVNVSTLAFKSPILPDTAALPTVYGKLGFDLSRYVSTELRVGSGFMSDDMEPHDGVNVDLQYMISGNIKGSIKTQGIVVPYGMIGYSRQQVRITGIDDHAFDIADNDVSAAVGLDFILVPVLSVNVEYTSFLSDSGTSLSGLSTGIAFKF